MDFLLDLMLIFHLLQLEFLKSINQAGDFFVPLILHFLKLFKLILLCLTNKLHLIELNCSLFLEFAVELFDDFLETCHLFIH